MQTYPFKTLWIIPLWDLLFNLILPVTAIYIALKLVHTCSPWWLISWVMNVSYLLARQIRWKEVKWISGTPPLEHSLLVPKAESHRWSFHAWEEAEGQNSSRNLEISCCFVSSDKMWLYVTCVTKKGRRLNEAGFGRKTVSFLRTTVWKEVDELSTHRPYFSIETSPSRPHIPQARSPSWLLQRYCFRIDCVRKAPSASLKLIRSSWGK